MSRCPYTLVKNLIGFRASGAAGNAKELRVTVIRDGERKVDVALPAASARWLIELIPEDVLARIREEGIPIDDIQKDLAKREVFRPQKIFVLTEPHRTVEVWLA
ncbi:MAG: hypothetical protein P4M08_05385 [Oligoflexia bacterium]|nr:hypothetical protein [Oligoflexia bacterium]